MSNISINHKFIPKKQRSSILIIISLIFLITLGCGFSIDPSQDTGLENTQIALGIQQTQAAFQAGNNLQATMDSQKATLDAQNVLATAASQQFSADLAATKVAQAVLETMAANQPPPPVEPENATTAVVEPVASDQDLKSFMKTANILLYEDIVNYPQLSRYVKKTLDGMGLNYKDDGSAKGWFKNDLLAGGPGGKPWDLVIIAAESRSNVSGEFFEYTMNVLNQGTSVIVEAWYLDQISQGTVSTILSKCGVDVTNYVGKERSLLDLLIWPISGVDHPILHEPNSGLNFSKAVNFWPYEDLGDLVTATERGDAQILMGRKPQEKSRNGVLTTCLNGKLTLMTFSSHSFTYQTVSPLWENMITYALKVRMANR